MTHKCSTIQIIAFLFLSAISLASMADTLTWMWSPATTREDGTPITGDTLYKINTCYELLTDETQFTTTLEENKTYTFEIRQLEDGVEGEAFIKRIRVE